MMRPQNGGAYLSNDSAETFRQGYVPEPQLRSMDLDRIWKTLQRRRKLFALVAIPMFLLVVLFTVLQKTQYSTYVRMIAGSANADSSSVTPSNGSGGGSLSLLNAMLAARGTQTPETYVDLLLQPTIAQEVAQKIGLDASPARVLAAVKAKPVPDTSILALTATWSDPKTAAAIANNWAEVFVEHERTLIGKQADALLTATSQQLPDAEQKVESAQNELSEYQQSVGIASLPDQTTAIVTNESTLEAKLNAAVVEGQQASAALSDVQSQIASTPPTIIGSQNVAANPVAQSADADVARLKAQLAQARQQYTDAFPTVIALRAQLAEAIRARQAAPAEVNAGTSTIPNPVYQTLQTQAATLSGTIASAAAQVDTLKQQLSEAKPKLDALPEKARRIADLERNVKAAQDYYEGLQQKNREAVIAKSTSISDVTVTQAADPETATAKPNRLLNIIVGFVIALVLGLIAVFAAEFIDDRFRTADDIRDRLGLPLLGTIPQFDDAAIARDEWIKPLTVESFHQLVASLRYASNDPPRSITFTSPDRGDGKSTVVYNTALSMGMMGQRVLVIDGDLRRPTIHEKFGIPNDRGLVDVLVGLANLEDVIRPTDNPDVFVLTAGRVVPNPVALLQSEAFDRVLRETTGRFQQVLVDGPALRPIVDSLMLGLKTDGVVLVVSSPNSTGRTVSAALDKLRSVGSINLLGIVLNGATADKREYSPYYLGMGQSISLPGGAK